MVRVFAIAFDMASCSRKRSVVTLEKKLEVIALLKGGKSQRSVLCVHVHLLLNSKLRAFQNYGHHLVLSCPDKWSSTVLAIQFMTHHVTKSMQKYPTTQHVYSAQVTCQ